MADDIRHPAPPERAFNVRVPGIVLWSLNELFTVSLVTYLAFYLLDSFIGSFISKQFDMDILLWIVIASGALSLWLNPIAGRSASENGAGTRQLSWKMAAYVVALGIAAASVIFLKTKVLGRTGWLISMVSAVLVMWTSFAFLLDEGRDDTDQLSKE